jgi:hypothetical protein
LASTESGAFGRVRVDAERHRDVVHLAVGEQAAGFDLPGVEHLAAQRQDRLQFLVAPILAEPPASRPRPGRSRCGRSSLWQSESLPGRMATPDCLRFSTFWPARVRACACADGQLGEPLGGVGVLVEPQLQRIAHHARDQRDRVARVQRSLV